MRRRVPQEKTTKTTSSGKGIVTRRAGYANAFPGSVWKCENWNLFFKEKVGNESCWSMRVVYVSWVVCNKNQWIPMETCVLYYIAIIDLLATTAMAVVRLPAISIDPFQLFCHHWGVVVFQHSPCPHFYFPLKRKMPEKQRKSLASMRQTHKKQNKRDWQAKVYDMSWCMSTYPLFAQPCVKETTVTYSCFSASSKTFSHLARPCRGNWLQPFVLTATAWWFKAKY